MVIGAGYVPGPGDQMACQALKGHGRRSLSVCVTVACAVAGVVAFSISSPAIADPIRLAEAGTASTSPWGITPTLDPSPTSNSFDSVSCVQQFCMAVGQQSDGGGVAPLAEAWDGDVWRVVPMSAPGSSSTSRDLPQLTLVNGVSCPSQTFCVAVGESNASGRWMTLVERWDGASWSVVQSGDTASFQDYLHGVSCSTTKSCTAVGSYTDGHVGQQNGTLVESMGGDGSFSIVPSPNQASSLGNLSTPANRLFSVACPSAASFCAAVGYDQNEAASGAALPRDALAESAAAGAWSLARAVSPGGSTQLNAVSCTSPTGCTAVGWSSATGSVQPLIESWDGQSWSTDPVPVAGTSLEGVSCPMTGSCTAVGWHGLVEAWDGKTWSVTPTPAGTSATFESVSCTSATCTAVGSTRGPGSATRTFAEQRCISQLAPGPASETNSGALTSGSHEMTAGGKRPLLGFPLFEPPCPLDVKAYPLEGRLSPFPVGLHYSSNVNGVTFFDPGRSDPLPDYVPIDAAFAQKCGTGCSNVVVVVRTPGTDGKAVPDANVTLKTSNVAPEDAAYPYPTFLGQFQYRGQVCAVDGDSEVDCGTSAKARTDDKGVAYFRYWAPGVAKAGRALLTATAEGSPESCGCGKAVGSGSETVQIGPNIVFARYAPLPASTVRALELFARGELTWSNFSLISNLVTKWLPGLQLITKAAGSIELATDLAVMDLFKLDPHGLVILDPRDYAFGLAGNSFVNSFTSMLKAYGSYLDNTPDINTRSSAAAQYMQLTLSEQSYCDTHSGGTTSLCALKGAAQHPHVLFSLSANKTKQDLIDLEDGFHYAPPTSVEYNVEWAAYQILAGGYISNSA